MNQVQIFSIRKLKAGVASVAVGLFMMVSHQVNAEEHNDTGKYDDSVSPKEQAPLEADIEYEVRAEDEVITEGSFYDLTDNVYIDSDIPAVEITDVTENGMILSDVPGEYSGTVMITFEDGEVMLQEVHVIVKTADEFIDDENTESLEGSKDTESQAKEETPEPNEKSDSEIEDEALEDSEADVTDETPESDEEADSESPQDSEENVTDETPESDEEADSEADSESPQDPEEDVTDETPESDEEADSEADSESPQDPEEDVTDKTPESDEEADSEADSEIPEDSEGNSTEVNETTDEGPEEDLGFEYNELPEDNVTESELDEEYPEEHDIVLPDDTEEPEEKQPDTPELTERKANETEAYLDDFLTEDEVSEVLGNINIDFERLTDEEEMRKELTRSLMKYLSDLQKENEYQAVAPPVSRVMTKANSQGKSLDSLYPLNFDRSYNKGDFTADARVEWVAIANYTRLSTSPNNNSLYLVDGKNPINHGHFEIQQSEYLDEVSNTVKPLWTLSIGTAESLENIDITLQSGVGPSGQNWKFTDDQPLNFLDNETFKSRNNIVVSKRFSTGSDTSPNNISYSVAESQLNLKVKRMNAGEHIMFSIAGSPLMENGIQKKEYFIADGRLSADHI